MKDFSKKNILIILNANGVGGAEKVCWSLANEFSKKYQSNVTIVHPQSNMDYIDYLDRSVTVLNLNLKSLKTALPKIISIINKGNFDCLIANIWPITILGILASLISKKTLKVITVDHCLINEETRDMSIMKRFFSMLSIKIFYKFAHKNIAVSESISSEIHDIAKIKPEVIYNPIDYQVPTMNELSDPDYIFWKNLDSIKIISVGTLQEQKNHKLIIEISEILKNLKIEFSTCILGEGPERHNLEREIHHRGLTHNCYLFGFKKNPYPFMEASNIFLLCARNEGFGNVLIEAMHADLDIIAHDDSSGPSEALKRGEFGKLIDNLNPHSFVSEIKTIIDNKGSKNTNRQQYLKRFDTHEVTEAYIEAIS